MELQNNVQISTFEIRNALMLLFLTENDDFNLDVFQVLPSNFWDPVVVNVPNEQIDILELIEVHEECLICTSEQEVFKKIPCCKNIICIDCTYKWFGMSVKCPFCKSDIRS
jgi:hypothetical protein